MAMPRFSSPRSKIVSPDLILNTSRACFGITIWPFSPTVAVQAYLPFGVFTMIYLLVVWFVWFILLIILYNLKKTSPNDVLYDVLSYGGSYQWLNLIVPSIDFILDVVSCSNVYANNRFFWSFVKKYRSRCETDFGIVNSHISLLRFYSHLDFL